MTNTNHTAPEFAAFLIESIASAETATAETAMDDRDAAAARREMSSLHELVDALKSEGGATAECAFAKFFDLCAYHDRYLGGAGAIGLRTRGCQAIAMAGDEIVRVAIAQKTAHRKLSRIEVAEKLRDALADAEPNVEWKVYAKGDSVRLYATMRGNGNDRGFLWIDKDGDVICDQWATSESARKREKIMADRIASLEAICSDLGVGVYSHVS